MGIPRWIRTVELETFQCSSSVALLSSPGDCLSSVPASCYLTRPTPCRGWRWRTILLAMIYPEIVSEFQATTKPEVIDCFLYRFPSWLVCCPKGTLSIQSAAAGSVWNNNFWAVINVEINFWGKPGPTTKLDKRWFPGDYFDWLSITYLRGLLLSIQKQPTPAGWLQAEI